ncbi:MAG: competence/damage-inducible protein A [Kiritimatiellia bacterium]
MIPGIELISTGTELLIGRTVNSHAHALAKALAPTGVRLVRDTTIPDDPHVLLASLKEALQRVDVVVVSGGLGPTSDDITRETIAAWLDRPLVLDKTAADKILQACKTRGLEASQARLRQALVVGGATVWQNLTGAAPGELIEKGGKYVVLLPGPPRELEPMLVHSFVPWIQDQFKLAPPPEQIFLLTGRAEGDMVTLFEKNHFPPDGIEVAYCASPGSLEIRLYAKTQDKLKSVADQARKILGNSIFAEERVTLEEVVGRLLVSKKMTLATAESCTGGLLGHRITNVSGSSKYYLGGVVVYDNRAKTKLLGVSEDTLAEHGAVSADTAKQMAEGVRMKLGADFGIGITGIAGPTGGTIEKPVGLVFIALAGNNHTEVCERRLSFDRDMVKFMSTQAALDMLRMRLMRE